MYATIEHVEKITIKCSKEEYVAEKHLSVLHSLGFTVDSAYANAERTKFTVTGVKLLAPTDGFSPEYADPVTVVRNGLEKLLEAYAPNRNNGEAEKKEEEPKHERVAPVSNEERTTLEDAALELGLSVSTIRTYFNIGKLEKVQGDLRVFVTRKSVEEYKQRQANYGQGLVKSQPKEAV